MAERFTLSVLTITFILGVLVLHGAYRTPCADSDFNLILRYGVGAKNELNTFKGTYTKDMVNRPSITTRLCLTREELDAIHLKALEIDLYNFTRRMYSPPEGNVIGEVTPYSTYYLEVRNGTTIKILRWSNRFTTTTEHEKYDDIMGLVRLIIEIVESHPEYKKLPEPTAGYV
jgi:hypothetical protein